MLCLVTLAGSAAMSRGSSPQILTTSLHSCIVRWWEAEECASAPVRAYGQVKGNGDMGACSVRLRRVVIVLNPGNASVYVEVDILFDAGAGSRDDARARDKTKVDVRHHWLLWKSM